MGLFRTVIFTPDELQLIKGAPVFRRRFLDMEISQVSPRYYAELLRYTRAVQQRNAAFRNARMTGIIPDTDIWDEQIGKCAAYIVRKRLETLKKMNGTVPDMESALTGNRKTSKSATNKPDPTSRDSTKNGSSNASLPTTKKTPNSATPP